jgi:hypothetical protein
MKHAPAKLAAVAAIVQNAVDTVAEVVDMEAAVIAKNAVGMAAAVVDTPVVAEIAPNVAAMVVVAVAVDTGPIVASGPTVALVAAETATGTATEAEIATAIINPPVQRND